MLVFENQPSPASDSTNAAVGHTLVYYGQKASPIALVGQAWPLRSLGQETGLNQEREGGWGWGDGYTRPQREGSAFWGVHHNCPRPYSHSLQPGKCFPGIPNDISLSLSAAARNPFTDQHVVFVPREHHPPQLPPLPSRRDTRLNPKRMEKLGGAEGSWLMRASPWPTW